MIALPQVAFGDAAPARSQGMDAGTEAKGKPKADSMHAAHAAAYDAAAKATELNAAIALPAAAEDNATAAATAAAWAIGNGRPSKKRTNLQVG